MVDGDEDRNIHYLLYMHHILHYKLYFTHKVHEMLYGKYHINHFFFFLYLLYCCFNTIDSTKEVDVAPTSEK